MDQQRQEKNQPHIVQMMTTEHYNLQSGRSLAISDANGRAGLFLGTVSSTLVALAFIGKISHDARLLYPADPRRCDWHLQAHALVAGFFTLAGILAVINNILAGVFLGLLVSRLLALSLPLCMTLGLGVFLVILVAQLRYQYTQWQAAIRQLGVLFPRETPQRERR